MNRTSNGMWWRLLRAHAYAVLVIGTFLVIIPGGLSTLLGGALSLRPYAMPLTIKAVVGLGLGLLGGGLSYGCMLLFVVRGKGTAFPTDPPNVFVAMGPYRWLRNPMYLGNLALAFGIGLLLDSAVYVVYALVLALVTHFYVVGAEEPRLRDRFGTRYEEYCTCTPRWLPKPPR